MIASKIVAEVRRLLAEQRLSQRQIARTTGLSRGTVGAIASGRRPDYQTPPTDDPCEESAGPPVRCPGCGGLVYIPCRLCRAQIFIVENLRNEPRRRGVPLGKQLRLNLRPEHQARYEEVRRWRRENSTEPFNGSVAP